jgi:hypothetical protein
MLLTVESADRKRKLLEESYVLLERRKKMRALNCNPRLVGINPKIENAFSKKR